MAASALTRTSWWRPIADDAKSNQPWSLVRQTEKSLTLVECFVVERNSFLIAAACRLPNALNGALNAFFAVVDQRTSAHALRPRRNLQSLIREGAA